MDSMQVDMNELRQQLRSGSIQKAYRALLGYMMDLRKHFQERSPDYSVSGLYQGYLDMTYFAVVPPWFKGRGLKIAIVFNYGAFRFEAWLAGSNRQVQRKYWELFKDTPWAGYRVVTPAVGVDSIVECSLAEYFDFRDPDTLTSAIEKKAAKFTNDIERFLSRHDNRSRG
jgi:hypothetical protein